MRNISYLCTIIKHIVLLSFAMDQLTAKRGRPSGLELSQDNPRDAQLIHIWLSTKTSSETRRAYTGEIARFLDVSPENRLPK